MKNPWFVVSVWVVVTLSGCVTRPQADSEPTPDLKWIVNSGAAGPIRLGMTLPELRNVLEPGYRLIDPPNLQILEESPRVNSGEAEIGGPSRLIINDQFAIRDPAGKIVLKFLLSDSSSPLAPGNRIVMITATGSRFSTQEGVRPGTSINEAGAIYGAPTLIDDDREGFGREWVAFLNGPGGIRFEAGQDGRLAGIYSSSETSTTAYAPGAKIRAIVIGRR